MRRRGRRKAWWCWSPEGRSSHCPRPQERRSRRACGGPGWRRRRRRGVGGGPLRAVCWECAGRGAGQRTPGTAGPCPVFFGHVGVRSRLVSTGRVKHGLSGKAISTNHKHQRVAILSHHDGVPEAGHGPVGPDVVRVVEVVPVFDSKGCKPPSWPGHYTTPQAPRTRACTCIQAPARTLAAR